MQSGLCLIGLWLCLPTLSFKIVVLIGLLVNCSFRLQVREDIQAADQEATQAVDQEVIQAVDQEVNRQEVVDHLGLLILVEAILVVMV